MGIYANGGLPSKISFVTLAVLWIFFTATALVKARNGDYVSHRNFMMRSYALTLSALTLRAWKWSMTNSFELPPMDVYRAVAWLSGGCGISLFLILFFFYILSAQEKKKPATARPGGKFVEHLKYLKRVFHIAERRRDLHALDNVLNL